MGQCVDNAECSSPTGGLCECNAGFYNDAGVCVSVKPAGKGCTASFQVQHRPGSSPLSHSSKGKKHQELYGFKWNLEIINKTTHSRSKQQHFKTVRKTKKEQIFQVNLSLSCQQTCKYYSYNDYEGKDQRGRGEGGTQHFSTPIFSIHPLMCCSRMTMNVAVVEYLSF